MNDQIDWTTLDHARVMGLDYIPKTPTAVAFCEAVGDALTALEKHRKDQRRGDRKKAFNETAGATAADLLKAAQYDCRRWSWRLQSTESFTDAPVSYIDFKAVLTAAEAGHLIEKYPGHYRRFDFGQGKIAGSGVATRLRAKPKLIAFAAQYGLTPQNIAEHFERQRPKLPSKPLVLRASSTRMGPTKLKGRSLRFERTALTDRIEKEVRDHARRRTPRLSAPTAQPGMARQIAGRHPRTGIADRRPAPPSLGPPRQPLSARRAPGRRQFRPQHCRDRLYPMRLRLSHERPRGDALHR